jgi:hypothetical protein
MPQLQINQGPQDALLYDNSRSYFKQIGYSRTSNFQLEYRDIDPGNTANLGATVQFVIPKCADLLGPVDLMVEFDQFDSSGISIGTTSDDLGKGVAVGWVEALGYQMIDYMTFSVGTHECERITGDQMYIYNELAKSDKDRYGTFHTLKTGRPLMYHHVYDASGDKINHIVSEHGKVGSLDDVDGNRMIFYKMLSAAYVAPNTSTGTSAQAAVYDEHIYKPKKLCIPLNFFFTKSADKYFPVCAIAGSHDIRISIKFRTFNELVQVRDLDLAIKAAAGDAGRTQITGSQSLVDYTSSIKPVSIKQSKCQLRCSYVHVTGPEATDLMNSEQVRLMRLMMTHHETKSLKPFHFSDTATEPDPQSLFDFELPFLHPVQELIIIIRKVGEMNASLDSSAKPNADDQLARTKTRLAFHGSGKDPNIDSLKNCTMDGMGGGHQTEVNSSTIKVSNFHLTLNGQERHPSLAATGMDRKYLMERVIPALHSNSTTHYANLIDCHSEHAATHGNKQTNHSLMDFRYLEQMMDRKEIYVYPFCIAPESSNPSGAVNFSKVSHARIKISGIVSDTRIASTDPIPSQLYQCEVHAVHFNWLSIKDGRAITSFA